MAECIPRLPAAFTFGAPAPAPASASSDSDTGLLDDAACSRALEASAADPGGASGETATLCFTRALSDVASIKRRLKVSTSPGAKGRHTPEGSTQRFGRTFHSKHAQTSPNGGCSSSSSTEVSKRCKKRRLDEGFSSLQSAPAADAAPGPGPGLAAVECSDDVADVCVEPSTAVDACARKARLYVGPFAYDPPRTVELEDPRNPGHTLLVHEGVTAREVQVLRDLIASGWPNAQTMQTDVLDFLNDDVRGVPLRYFEFVLTNLSKGCPVVLSVTRADGSVEQIDPHVSYKHMIKSFGRKLFDPFKRGTYIFFEMHGAEHTTTVGQLNFMWFIQRYKLLEYVRSVSDETRVATKGLSLERALERATTGQRKRQPQLTRRVQGVRSVVCTSSF